MINTSDIKSRVTVTALFQRDGCVLQPCGDHFKCLCPFHREKSPSCAVYSDHYFCFGCNQHGDAITYMMLTRNCTFIEACEMLGVKLETRPFKAVRVQRTPPPPPVNTEDFETRMDDWKEQTSSDRLFSLATALSVTLASLVALEVAWAPEHNAWAIPMRKEDRTMIGIRLRDDHGKKWAVKGSRNGLFIPLGKPERDLYVTEGPTDCAAALSLGLFAVGKAMALMAPEPLLAFARAHHAHRIIVVPDNDEQPGRDNTGMAGASRLISACRTICCELVLPTKDLREFRSVGGTRALFDQLLIAQRWIHPKNP